MATTVGLTPGARAQALVEPKPDFVRDNGVANAVKVSVVQPSAAVEGVGLLVFANGVSADVLTPDTWRGTSDETSNDTRVGVGWRRSSLSAVIGYVRPNADAEDPIEPSTQVTQAQRFKPQSMMGLSLALSY